MNRLKEIRKREGKSQIDLCKSTGIAPSDISRIENNLTYAYSDWRKHLTKSLKVSENEIFHKEDQ
jgi:transcriptional regulator with XRE-family HTH domain